MHKKSLITSWMWKYEDDFGLAFFSEIVCELSKLPFKFWRELHNFLSRTIISRGFGIDRLIALLNAFYNYLIAIYRYCPAVLTIVHLLTLPHPPTLNTKTTTLAERRDFCVDFSWPQYLYYVVCIVFTVFKKMSENRFKISKADPDGVKDPKETYRRVNLSTDIQVNIIEPCMWDNFFFVRKLTPRVTKISIILCHTPVILAFSFMSWISCCFQLFQDDNLWRKWLKCSRVIVSLSLVICLSL